MSVPLYQANSSLSRQLAVLRRSGIVTSRREGSTVVYALASADVATEMLTGQNQLPAPLRNAGDDA